MVKNNLKKITSYILTVMLVTDFIFIPFTFEEGSLFKQGVKLGEYLFSGILITIFWVYLINNFCYEKMENSPSYKIAKASMPDKYKKSFDFHHMMASRLAIMFIFAFVSLLFGIVILNYKIILQNIF